MVFLLYSKISNAFTHFFYYKRDYAKQSKVPKAPIKHVMHVFIYFCKNNNNYSLRF